MPIEFNTRKKLRAFIAQIDHLLLSDFPHDATESALMLVRDYFDTQISRLDRSARLGDPKVISQTCITINERIYSYLPILGFLLRSTNVRNSFESYGAFVEIATGLVGPKAKVIMSSEWDFSPLTYPMNVSVLPDYVLLGMPTSEAFNALILPLAGHELGHSVWVSEDLEAHHATELEDQAKEYIKKNWSDFKRAFPEHSQIQPTDDELQNNMFIVYVISEIVGLTTSQIEETFCDAVGMHLFGASYAHAFHYLLAPSLGGIRALEYPRLPVRAEFMNKFGGLDLRLLGFENYVAEFQDSEPSLAPRDEFISKAADTIAYSQASSIYSEAQLFVAAGVPDCLPTPDGQEQVYRMFRNGIPARRPTSLADILNAGWEYVRTEGQGFDESKRPLFEWVSELVLKSIEVLEFRRRTGNA